MSHVFELQSIAGSSPLWRKPQQTKMYALPLMRHHDGGFTWYRGNHMLRFICFGLSFIPMALRINSAAHTSYCKKTKWAALERVLLSLGCFRRLASPSVPTKTHQSLRCVPASLHLLPNLLLPRMTMIQQVWPSSVCKLPGLD